VIELWAPEWSATETGGATEKRGVYAPFSSGPTVGSFCPNGARKDLCHSGMGGARKDFLYGVSFIRAGNLPAFAMACEIWDAREDF